MTIASTSTSSPSQGLLFSFLEMNIEIENMRKLSAGFLEETSFYSVIPMWQQELSSYQMSRATASFPWTIGESKPIRTIPSIGKYECGGDGSHTVIGEVSAKWEIQLVRLKGKKKNHAPSLFSLNGLASTKVRILEVMTEGERELARWRFEIGDFQSPGCHFHVQVLGDHDDEKFPKSLAVPRLPGIMVTPMDALEFLLAELFQDEWKNKTSRSSDALTAWAACQRKRLTKVLEWQQTQLSTGSGSPWTLLKGGRPDSDLLTKASQS